MGHVSDFKGMNSCDEAELNQATSDLISADNLLNLPLNENFMPIYQSFPDDIYRQPHLYGSNNLSFMNNDDDRNGYFDEPLELDLLLDSNFNIDFDPTEAILENDSSVAHHRTEDSEIEVNLNEECENDIHDEDEPVCVPSEVSSQNSKNQDQEDHINVVDNFSSNSHNKDKTHNNDTNFNDVESDEDKTEQIPKLIIKLKVEPQSEDQDFSYSDTFSIANTVETNSKDNENNNFECVDIKIKDKHKHKKHKKKSRHKKKRNLERVKNKTLEVNQNFNDDLSNCTTKSYINDKLFLNKNTDVNIHMNDSETHILNNQNSDNNSDENLHIDKNFDTYENNYLLRDIKSEPSDDETDEKITEPLPSSDYVDIKTESSSDEITNGFCEPLVMSDAVDFEFEFANTDDLSLSSSNSIKKEKDSPVDDFSYENNSDYENDDFDNENIPSKSVSETIKTPSSTDSLDYNGYSEPELDVEDKSTVSNNEPVKSSSASDLIEELNAHHQQVFEEIEVSTTELDLEINNSKNPDIRPKTSHQTHISANDHIISPNKVDSKHSENDMNSQNHLSVNKASSPSHHVSAFGLTSNHLSNTARLRNISSSSSSVNSKTSTSHRSYRKRRRSSSSSSSCSNNEKFYNRPVKFDPVTQTYCDEFGREIRASELKFYLDTRSSFRDSHSNNGSSSSSRSKSPRYKKYHRKHHKSRSGSRSHRKRRHSSSRSRSRSRSRRHKDFDRKYRSPSPKHRSKRHYLDVEENMRAYEERRVMYVGDIPPDYTVEQLKERFSRFGPIQTASIKSKFTADGSLYIFGFVTFKNRSDVCQAIERGNENPSWPRFDLNFGGRRRFCNGNYTDLDGKVAEAESGWYQPPYRPPPRQEDDFAELLRQEQKRLGMSKK